MTYILAHKRDDVAHWLKACLIKSGLIYTKMLFAEEMMQIKSMDTIIEADGSVSGNIVFSNGERLDVTNSVIINRLQYLPYKMNRYAESEKDYIGSELNAILVFFLNAAQKVIFNKVDCNGFNGINYSNEEWDVLFKKAGFESQIEKPDVYPSHYLTAEKFLIYEGVLFPNIKAYPDLEHRIEKLVKLTGILNFSLTLFKSNNDFIVKQINTLPDLRVGGNFIIENLKRKIIKWYL